MTKGLLVGLVVIAAIVVVVAIIMSGDSDTTTANLNVSPNQNINSANVNSAATSPVGTDVNDTPGVTGENVFEESDETESGGVQAEVSVTESGFVPAISTITAGDSVIWTNNSSVFVHVAPDSHPEHTDYPGIWEDDGRGKIDPGESYAALFSTPGTYQYHDHEDENQTGTIIVQ